MRFVAGVLLAFLIVQGTVGSSVAQVADGDVLVLVAESNTGYLLRVNPVSGSSTTLVPRVSGWSPSWLRMAPDNQRLVASYFSVSPNIAVLVSITLGGPITPVVTVPNSVLLEFALDHDNRWIVMGAFQSSFGALAVEETSGTATTLFQWPVGQDAIGSLCIDRDPGSSPYVVTVLSAPPSTTTKVLRADRGGVRSTLQHVSWGTTAIALERPTGHYLLGSWGGPAGLHRLQKNGGIASIATAITHTAALRSDADGSFWVIGYMGNRVLAKLDGSGTVLRVFPLSGISAMSSPLCLEVYGSRKLVCTGPGTPGTTVNIRLQSGRAGDGNCTYALACSLARRPGLRFGNGERLDLSVGDPLFLLTAANQLPGVFRSFHGVTDSAGRATAQVLVPSGLPPGSGIAVFVAGIVYDANGVRTTTNTHWFVLN